MRRLAIFSACYWAAVACLVFFDALLDCGASGEPELRCPPAQAHLEWTELLAIALFIPAAIWIVLKPSARPARISPAASGCLGAVLVLLGYIAIGWWIYSGLP